MFFQISLTNHFTYGLGLGVGYLILFSLKNSKTKPRSISYQKKILQLVNRTSQGLKNEWHQSNFAYRPNSQTHCRLLHYHACGVYCVYDPSNFSRTLIDLQNRHNPSPVLFQYHFSFLFIDFFFIGPAADKFELPKIAAIGLALLAISVFCASTTTQFSAFIVAMAFTGSCAALVPAAMFPHISLIAPKEKSGAYVGSIVAAGTVGVVFGRTFVGILTDMYGWQNAFRFISGLLFFCAILTFITLVGNNSIRKPSTKKLSQLYANSVKLLLSFKVLSLLIIGFLLFFAFLGMLTFLTYRLVGPTFNFTSGEIGYISLAGLTALIAPFVGNFSHKFGIFKILIPGMAVCFISLQLLGWSSSVVIIIIGTLLLFISVYSCQPLVFILMGKTVAPSALGSASSLYILFCIGGGSLSSVVLGPVWSTYGWAGITIACSASLIASFLTLTVKTIYEKRIVTTNAQHCNDI